ncbi:hybrid sensor histidine kinase/response regulator transcription factor [Reichenbachiella ulvae]|uniref:histidine kinase n=1 Tax=Reichenbachiella ulvae TaxID=2980104 RepID=A0ABT3D0F3_9BACT|nr:hybrid sensor histidine kinase/response regulator transcription factor [Reichenbachiella ulvae]MCV9389294.1 response regulator [Reichenbachiella ulvae]
MKILTKWIGQVVMMVGLVVTSQAQHNLFQFRQFTIDQGLSHTDVLAIAQDSIGFIWIGSFAGLDRFDGYESKNYFNNYSKQRTGYINRVNDLCIADNKIWIGSEGGLEVFDIKLDDYLVLDKSSISLDSHFGASILKVAESENELYLGTASGLTIYRFDSGEKKLYPSEIRIPDELTKFFCHDIQIDQLGNVWVMAGTHLYVKHHEVNQFVQLNVLSKGETQNLEYARIGFNDKDELIAVSNEGIFVYPNQLTRNQRRIDVNGYKFDQAMMSRQLSVPANQVALFRDIEVDDRGGLWLGSNYGVLHLENFKAPNRYTLYNSSPSDQKNDLSSQSINCLLIDRSNVLWAGTYGGGVNYTDLNRKQFHLIAHDAHDAEHSLSGDYVRAIYEQEDGNIWVGSQDNGLDYFDFESNRFIHYRHDNNNPNGLSRNEVRALAMDDQQRLWVGTHGGVDILDKNRRQFDHIRRNPESPGTSLSNDVIFSIDIDVFGQVWAGSWGSGLNRIRYRGKGDHEVSWWDSKTMPHFLSSDQISFVLADPDEPEIFVSTKNGLNHIYLDQKGDIEKIKVYRSSENNPHSITSNFIWPIAKLNDSTLWVGTLGGGLNRITYYPKDKEGYKAKAFTMADGLPSNDVESILIDNENLWLGGKGLTYFQVEDQEIRNFDVNDGLQSNSFKVGAAHRGASGRFYFGGIAGLNYFYPDSIMLNQMKPDVVLTNLTINYQNAEIGNHDNAILRHPLYFSDKIDLAHDQKVFEIHFSPLHNANAQKCRFKYRLKGHDDQWLYTNAASRKATFSNLEPGEYFFEVFATNNDGVWGDRPATITVEVHAPWWGSWVAKLIYATMAFMVIAFIYYLRMRSLRLEKAYEMAQFEEKKSEEIHNLRMQFFTNISHEFKTPLTLIVSPLEQIMNGAVEGAQLNRFYQMMNKNAKKLLNLIDELMYFRKVESGVMKRQVTELNVGELVEDIASSFIDHAMIKDIDLYIQLGNRLQTLWLDRSMFEKILSNLLVNALKYTENGGRVQVKVFDNLKSFKPSFIHDYGLNTDLKFEDYIWINVIDNGMGMSKSVLDQIFDRYYRVSEAAVGKEPGSGLGLALVKSLVLLNNGVIKVFSEKGKGTEFLVGFLKGNEHLNQDEILVDGSEVKTNTSPIIKHELEVISQESQVSRSDHQVHREKILIVEDEAELRMFIRESLGAKYEVREAANGKEALESIRDFRPDVVVSDYSMPVMDGAQLCESLKEDLEYSHIPFIMLTAKTSEESKISGTQAGADAYLTKPFTIQLLELTIDNFVNSRKRLRELYVNDAFTEAKTLALNEREQEFMDQLNQIIQDNLSNPEFGVDFIAKMIGMSRTKLYNKTKDITGQALGELVRNTRLNKAAQMLVNEDLPIIDVMYRVGIQSSSNFTKVFKKKFGKTPSDFVAELKKRG